MCGIAGILKIHAPGETVPHHLESIPEPWLDILDESIRHRGPDGQGRFRDRSVREDGTTIDVAFVHRRLSILDRAGGHQPMVHDGERLRADLTYQPGEDPKLAHELCPDSPLMAVLFNGCIYNHRDLREELEARGHVFETDHSDTEMLVHGWREWGEGTSRGMPPKGKPYPTLGDGLFSRLEGMWSLAVWSRDRHWIRLSVDRHREKPLWEHKLFGSHVFASNPRALERIAGLLGDESDWPASPNIAASIQWGMAGDTHGANRYEMFDTLGLFDDIGTPLHGWTWYRNEDPWRPQRDRTETLTAASVDAMIASSVSARLDADVPTGVFLSGGIDSGIIAAHAVAARPDVTAYTVRMPDPRYDESDAAAETAGYLGIEHRMLECEPHPARDLIELIEKIGIPFGDSSLLPTYWVCRAARREVSVALAGDGGDELFAGYDRHRIAGPLKSIRPLLMLIPGMLIPERDPKSRMTRLARLGRAAREDGYSGLLRLFQASDFRRLTEPNWFMARVAPWPADAIGMIVASLWNISTALPGSSRRGTLEALDHDLFWYLPNDLLFKTDAASMHCALEIRCPFLDSALVRAVQRAPLDSLMPNGQRKGLLRQVARKHLPNRIVDRPKQGFAIPIGEWFRTDYGDMRQLLLDHLRSSDPFPGLGDSGVEINMKSVERLIREHDAAGFQSINPWHGRDHSQRLYMLLVLSIWSKWLERTRREQCA
ncbi:MAG: asparagine synthase-related protein [Planctomycetota bacterium]